MNNLFISYDLMSPGQQYDRVAEAIKGLGSWAKVHLSLWYVSSNYGAKAAADIVRKAMDANDKLIIVDASNNDAAWYNLDSNVSAFVQQNWNSLPRRSVGY